MIKNVWTRDQQETQIARMFERKKQYVHGNQNVLDAMGFNGDKNEWSLEISWRHDAWALDGAAKAAGARRTTIRFFCDVIWTKEI